MIGSWSEIVAIPAFLFSFLAFGWLAYKSKEWWNYTHPKTRNSDNVWHFVFAVVAVLGMTVVILSATVP